MAYMIDVKLRKLVGPNLYLSVPVQTVPLPDLT